MSSETLKVEKNIEFENRVLKESQKSEELIQKNIIKYQKQFIYFCGLLY